MVAEYGIHTLNFIILVMSQLIMLVTMSSVFVLLYGLLIVCV